MSASVDHLKQLAIALGGGALGVLLLKNHYDESRKSQAEKDDAAGVKYVCEVIGELLEEWAPTDRESLELSALIREDCARFLLPVEIFTPYPLGR
jgi:hypothetical protein